MASYLQDNVEAVGALRLPLGGINGYIGVRGKQGRKKDKFQGTTPTKTRRTNISRRPEKRQSLWLSSHDALENQTIQSPSSTSGRRCALHRLRPASGRRDAGL